MINSRNQPIAMIKGDTLAFNVEFSDTSTVLSSAYFSAKQSYDDNSYVFRISLNNGISQIDNGVYKVRLAPSDTSSVTPGLYYYDLEVGINSDIYTLMFGEINILPEVS